MFLKCKVFSFSILNIVKLLTMKKITHSLRSITLILFPLLFLQAHAQSTANYDVSVTTIWNVTDHSSLPGSAHWSNLIGATHNTPDEFVSLGTVATTGIKDVAERGDNTEIINEINAVISANRADQLLQDGFSPFAGNNSMAGFMNITVSEDFPLVTLVSMVAPSPDWFIAVNSLNLRSGNPSINNGWKDTFTMDVFAYDAGTDDGIDYTSSNSPNTPVAVSMINGFPINGNKMATITFTYNSSTLSTNSITSLSETKIYPNPNKTGIVSIIKPNSHTIEQLDFYNILGSKVHEIVYPSNQQLMTLDISHLNPGIYLIKLTSGSLGETSIKKIIIN